MSTRSNTLEPATEGGKTHRLELDFARSVTRTRELLKTMRTDVVTREPEGQRRLLLKNVSIATYITVFGYAAMFNVLNLFRNRQDSRDKKCSSCGSYDSAADNGHFPKCRAFV